MKETTTDYKCDKCYCGIPKDSVCGAIITLQYDKSDKVTHETIELDLCCDCFVEFQDFITKTEN